MSLEVVKWVSDDVWFNWMHDNVALQWHIWFDDKSQGWAKIRAHDDSSKIPGPWYANMDVWMRNGEYMFVGYIDRNGAEHHPSDVYKELRKYLQEKLGLVEKKRVRFK